MARLGRANGWMGRAMLAVALVLVLGLGGRVGSARADGDPASDYLLTNQVFLASQATSPTPAQRQLIALVREANRAGLPLRVALVPSEYDMGSITELWGKPRLYARFLDLEISSTYRGRLLVVMPHGVGLAWPGHPAGPGYRALRTVAAAPGDSTLAVAARVAVEQLAASAGIRLAVPAARTAASPAGSAARGRTAHSGGGTSAVLIVGSAVAVLVLLCAVGAWWRRARARRAPQARPEAAHRPVPRVAVVAGVAGLFALAVAVPIVLVRDLRGASATADNANSTAGNAVITPPARSWAAGAQLAPNFVLRDQNGRAVSPAAYHGRPVIVTFVDPLCRNLCPLEAHLLNQVIGEMPAGQRPVVLAVSVDVYADSPADLHQDDVRWHLVPQWHWAVGSPAALAAVWRRYEVGVRVVTKHIERTAIRYITHTEAAYVIDATGHMRALFIWPFYPQDLRHVLSPLES
jgi:cytochrome oxidase Cu insertion factor (SCO1/SenC/PrrC family)